LFFRALAFTGARPSELAAATTRDFDPTEGTVRFASRKGKSSKLRTRYTVLDQVGLAFFTAQAKGKLPGASLFTCDGSQTWRRDLWAEEIRIAVVKHNEGDGKKKGAPRLPVGLGAYAFRHSRISELLQVHGIDPLTVASQTGTGLAMIEKNYLKFIPSAYKDKLAKLKAAP
jgi:integrase